MKIKCINNIDQEKYLAIDKIYEVAKFGQLAYGIRDDSNSIDYYLKSRFIKIDNQYQII